MQMQDTHTLIFAIYIKPNVPSEYIVWAHIIGPLNGYSGSVTGSYVCVHSYLRVDTCVLVYTDKIK